MYLNLVAAVRAAIPKKKFWLMSADEASNDASGSSRYSENKSSKDSCQASLMEILESQIIPNLLKANESASPFFSTDGARTELPTQEEIARFAQLCIDADADAPEPFVMFAVPGFFAISVVPVAGETWNGSEIFASLSKTRTTVLRSAIFGSAVGIFGLTTRTVKPILA